MRTKAHERLREEKRAAGDVQICPGPGCGVEVWIWNRVYCSKTCLVAAIKTRRERRRQEVEQLRAAGVPAWRIAERLRITESGVYDRLAPRGRVY